MASSKIPAFYGSLFVIFELKVRVWRRIIYSVCGIEPIDEIFAENHYTANLFGWLVIYDHLLRCSRDS